MPDLSPGLQAALADRYRLDRELGAGGMATVWLAHDLKHDRDVALKVLRPELAAVLGRGRFLAEVRLTARLDHPHILTLIDSGESDDFVWYVVPFIRGESLRQKLVRERQLGVAEALAITKQVAGALEYAHTQGVIHRDVKPENILLHEGEAMLADFGIALAVTEAAGSRLTETGLSLGTPQYMSPEQATDDRQLDGRTDVYSLAAVLYEMLAGEPPHSGPTARAVIAKLMTERPTRLGVVRDNVPEAIEVAVTRGLAKVPADRFDSPAEFAKALEAKVPGRPRARWPSPRVLGWVAGAAFCGAVGFAVLARARGTPSTLLVHRQLTFSGKVGTAQGSALALSPDGNKVAYVSGGRSLLVQPVNGGEPDTLVSGVRALYSPRWTRDGANIVFAMFRDSLELAATYSVPATGGIARKVVDELSDFDTGPDSQSVVRAKFGTNELEIVNLRSGRTVGSVTLPDSLQLTALAGGLRAAPGGRWVAASSSHGWILVSLRNPDAAPQALPQGSAFAWSPGGDTLYYLAGPIGEVDLRKVTVDSKSGRVGQSELVTSLPNATGFEVGPAGRLVYQRSSTTGRVYAWSIADGGGGRIEGLQPVTEGTRPAVSAAISDDGTRIALSRRRGTDLELEVASFAGGASGVVATSPFDEDAPSWSPDGSLIAFFRGDSLMVVAPSPDANPRRVGSSHGSGPAAWSADGQTIAYFVSNLGPIALVQLATGREQLLPIPDSVGTAAGRLAVSPDGREIIISGALRAQDWWTLWHVDVAGHRWTHLTMPFGEYTPLRWSPSGWVYLQSDRFVAADFGGVRTEFWKIRRPKGRAEYAAPMPDGCTYWSWSVSRDGRRGVCTLVRTEADLYSVGPSSGVEH